MEGGTPKSGEAVVVCACEDEAGADDLVGNEKLGKELVVPEEAPALVTPKPGKEPAAVEEVVVLAAAMVEGIAEDEEPTPKAGNAGVVA